MAILDITISIVVALIVNLMTPMIRDFLLSRYFSLRVKIIGKSNSILLKQKVYLEKSLAWHEERSDSKNLLKWLLPHLFNQLVMFFFIAFSIPLIINFPQNVVGEWLTIGIFILALRQIFLFILLGAITQDILFSEETRERINKQITDINTSISTD